MREWRKEAMNKIESLRQDRVRITELDARLSEQGLISESDRMVFRKAMGAIDDEIDNIHFDLALDDMLALCHLPLQEYLDKCGNSDPNY